MTVKTASMAGVPVMKWPRLKLGFWYVNVAALGKKPRWEIQPVPTIAKVTEIEHAR